MCEFIKLTARKLQKLWSDKYLYRIQTCCYIQSLVC